MHDGISFRAIHLPQLNIRDESHRVGVLVNATNRSLYGDSVEM